MNTLLAVLLASTISSYHIGNSLTCDSLCKNNSQEPYNLEKFAALKGIEENTDIDLVGGQALHVFWSTPDNPGLIEPTSWPTALQSAYDKVSLQPHDSQSSTLGSDLQTVVDFSGYAAGNPVWYILETWPAQSTYAGHDYSWYWDQPVVDDLLSLTIKKERYFDFLISRIRISAPALPVWVIPTGEVFNRISQAIAAGSLPSVTMADFYRDDVHLSDGLGTYVAGLTMAATMLHFDPTGMTAPASFNNPLLTTVVREELNGIIRQTLMDDLDSGYADFNQDGIVDSGDLVTWSESDRDGRDFLMWQRRVTVYNNMLAAVPEPTALAVFVVFVVCLAAGVISRLAVNAFRD